MELKDPLCVVPGVEQNDPQGRRRQEREASQVKRLGKERDNLSAQSEGLRGLVAAMEETAQVEEVMASPCH